MGEENIKANYRGYIMARDGFNIYDSRKVNSLSVMNYLFLLGDILIVRNINIQLPVNLNRLGL